MTEYHTIRLHGPWQADFFALETNSEIGSLTNEASSSGKQRVKLPLTVEPQEWPASRIVVLSRHFNWPHDPPDRAFVNVVSNVGWTVSVNEVAAIPFADQNRTSVGQRLNQRNLVKLTVELADLSEVISIDEVSLKIA